jgi:hypothetical protein
MSRRSSPPADLDDFVRQLERASQRRQGSRLTPNQVDTALDGLRALTRPLPPPDEVTDAVVELAAIECHHAACQNVPRYNPDYRRETYPWDGVPENGKEAWRAVARAAFTMQKARTPVSGDVVEAAEPLVDKLTRVEEAREAWSPSKGPIGDDYTIAIKAGLLRKLRAALQATGER